MSLNEQAYQENLAVVSGFEPSLLWRWFARIGAIAHPSYHEEALANDIVDWAKSQGLPVRRDAVGNVIINKAATNGMQDMPTIALQAHLDMVPQANADTVHDFTKDPIRFRLNPDNPQWLMATGTTLGADNGIGLASCLAVLESKEIAHPALEVLLTMTEETGMVGAIGLAANELSASMMINTDTEEIGEVYIGCAGGIDADVSLPVAYEDSDFDAALSISIKGLRGGHSGIDIHKNRGNAIKLIARVLATLQQSGGHFTIVQVQGGTLRNAIPREASAIIACQAEQKNQLTVKIEAICQQIFEEIKQAESGFVSLVQDTQFDGRAISTSDSDKLIGLMNALPSGVVRYSDTVEDTVETSLSLGRVGIVDGQFEAVLLVRSLIESGKEAICTVIDSIARLAGAKAVFDGGYVGWNPEPNSAITQLTIKEYTKILGTLPQVKVIHAGLECGLIKQSHPNLDIVSIGPTIKNAHSPDEMVDIASVDVYWQLLVRILANIKASA
ncbi:aminoacyl-histidine dipeptidase [Moraxella nasicaprae]|uniref:Aminoacyl-histidine dipeptidase n=1 Tax=Moraxella nasicaprae TaxID=2904122 RepID=A0ABY6F2A2_9GAMM|nr:aminoacyl-histidine dipeptidase [Moraxella nasicaprae]UXZ04206.1 aminoacyl-histidine dipeptidase [Moraxella nasicaprae]